MIIWLLYITTPIRPDNLKLPDCVIRAIQLAMDIPYSEVVMLLRNNADYYKCNELCVCCYEKLLDNDFKLPHFIGNGLTVDEIAKRSPNNTLLIRMDSHITCAINGVVFDIFDCTNEIVTDFWVVK